MKESKMDRELENYLSRRSKAKKLFSLDFLKKKKREMPDIPQEKIGELLGKSKIDLETKPQTKHQSIEKKPEEQNENANAAQMPHLKIELPLVPPDINKDYGIGTARENDVHALLEISKIIMSRLPDDKRKYLADSQCYKELEKFEKLSGAK